MAHPPTIHLLLSFSDGLDLLVRPVVEDEADAGLPALLQGDVGETLFHRAVVPLGQVRVAVGVVGRRPRLYPVHAPAALQPAEMYSNFAHSQCVS